MTAGRDDEALDHLVDALGPYVDRVVIVGGWAHRLFRHHPLAQPLSYPPLMTRDVDIAVASSSDTGEPSLRERLLAHGFREEYLGDDRPPVTHYHLAGDDAGFYVEFLTPLVGGEFTRGGNRDVTTPIAGVSAQKLRHLDVLLVSPWTVTRQATATPHRLLIANPVSYLAQKLLVSAKRKPSERAKDIVYIHDTLSLFGRSLTELHAIWINDVSAAIGNRTATGVRRNRDRLIAKVTDTLRLAVTMAPGRGLTPDGVLEVCREGLGRILDGPSVTPRGR
jgi:hypothetical protein